MRVDKLDRIKYIWKFAKPYKWSFVNAFLCILLTSVISMIYPYVFGLLVDEVFYSKNLKFFIAIVVGYAIIYLTEQLLHLILNILWPYQYNVYLLEVRKAIDRKLLSLKYEKIVKIPVGDMVAKINWQADAFVELIHRNIAYLCANTIKLLAIIFIVYSVNYKLAILLAVYVPVSYIVSYKLGKRIGVQQEKVQTAYKSFVGWVFEIISGIRDIKLFGAEKNTVTKFERQICEINKGNEGIAKAEVFSERVCAFIALATNISLYVMASLLIYKNGISLGEFIAVITYFETANTLLGGINKYWGKIHANMTIIDDVIAVLKLDSEMESNAPDIVVPNGEIEFDDVFFSYDNNKKVLNGFNLKISSGEKVAIVGKSGVGKSTVANLLLKFLDAEKGSIRIDGQNIAEYNAFSLREQIGIVQQEIFVFDESIRANLQLASPMATEEEMKDAIEKANLRNYVESLEKGLDTVLGLDGISMSGGEKQRLAIARLFLRKPQVVIFDEATSALDSESEFQVNEAWKKLAEGRTTIIIAHRLSTVLNADKIVVLDEGRVAAVGSHEVLVEQSPLYKILFEEQYMVKQAVDGGSAVS